MRKILISAYACEPGRGSEPGVGWFWSMELLKDNEIWVITRANNRSLIDQGLVALPKNQAERLHFVYYDCPRLIKALKKKERGLYLYYLFWQCGVFFVAKKIAATVKFDYCIHLTFGSVWLPTFLHCLGIPFIIGPLGGGEGVPFKLIKNLPWRGRLAQYARYLLIRLVNCNPFVLSPAKAAAAILVRTGDTARVFPQRYQHKVHTILETGISTEQLACYQRESPVPTRTAVRLVYTGRLVAFKNIAMAIEAFASARLLCENLEFTIVGEGPLRSDLELLAKERGVYGCVKFTGALGHEKVMNVLKESDIFVFPSLREGGTWSLFEAMAVGLPVICICTSGMEVITDDRSAIRVPVSSQDGMLADFKNSISRLAEDAKLRKRMGEHARRRVSDQFGWDQKACFMNRLLDQLDVKKRNRGGRGQ